MLPASTMGDGFQKTAWGEDATGLTEAEERLGPIRTGPEAITCVCSCCACGTDRGGEKQMACQPAVKRDQRGGGRRTRTLILSRQYLVRETCLGLS
jgi:hypothetical protein